MAEQRREHFSLEKGCRNQGESTKREKEQLQSGAAGVESQGEAIPALPILVTAAVGEITALAAVIPYRAEDRWSWVKQRS